VINYFNKINTILSKNDKIYLFALFVFSIFIAIVETIGVSIIMPYISVANDFSLIHNNKYYKYFYDFFNFQDEVNFLIIFGFIIVLFYIIRAMINAIYLYLIMKFTFTRYDNIINKLFQTYLKMPYKNFVNKNTSHLTKMIINEAANITELLKSTLLFTSEIFVFILISSILLYVNYEIVMIIAILITIISLLVLKTISKITKEKGKQREEHQKSFYEVLNKSFNNIKMLKLQSVEAAFDDFSKSSKLYTNTVMISATIQHFPRLIFEAFGFSIVIIIIIFILYTNNTNITAYYSTITIFILGLYRLLPSITRIFLNYNNILFYYKSLDLVYQDYNLESENLGKEVISFNNLLKLENISFSYRKDTSVIHNLCLDIKKNDKIAFIGESGSGKSTLVDTIMGLHKVTEGNIIVDSVKLTNKNLTSWRDHFGYIPQSVYLFDGTVAQNIAFGLNIDENKVVEVLKKANIWNVLETKDGINTKVGEGGVMLSGGQKQRIAIARALYKNPDILVLDEATSALDDDTERKIMDEIYEIAKDKTLIIIAHRLSTIKRCKKIYEIKNGELISI